MKRLRLCLLLVAAIFVMTMPGLAGEEKIILQVSGNGNRTLPPFTVSDRWEIRWDAKGDAFAVFLYDDKGKPARLGSSAKQWKPGPGSTWEAKGGSYSLSIISTDDWTIKIVQLP